MNKQIFFVMVVVTLFVSFALFATTACSDINEEKEYQEFRATLIDLYNAGKYEEISSLIEENYDRFPNKASNMSFNMALVCKHLEDYDRGIDYLAMAQERNQWFNIYAFEGEFWEPYRDRTEFEKILTKNIEMKDAAQKKAKPDLEVVLPEGFEESKSYPLFIALHGGGENIEAFKPRWKSSVRENEFIIAYVQSSQVASMNGFTWQDQEITKRELADAYNQICNKYPVNTEEVIVGGFSSGGYASLVATFFEAVPVNGFIILCPPMPDNITDAEVKAGRDRGVRGTIITTELDNRVPDQRGMADLFKSVGLQYQFIMTPNIGHWYPENLPELIDGAIAHIRSS